MRSWFDNLAPRERTILLSGGGVAIIIVLWGLIWRPLVDSRGALAEQVTSKTQLLGDVERARALAGPQTDNAAGQAAGQSILLVIDSSSRTFGLNGAFTQTRPNGPNEISVSFQRAAFDTLVAWLIELETAFGITVTTASVSDSGQSGLVNGQVFLSRE